MRLIASLAVRDLMRDWVQLLCNVAVLAGVIVPLLVLFGVKNGVFEALEGRLLNDPATLRIQTTGNNAFTLEDAATVAGWDGAGFVTPRTRSLFDYVTLRAPQARTLEQAILQPTGPGDPALPEGVVPGPGDVVLSEALATKLSAGIGTRIDLVTQAPERPRQLVLPRDVVAVLPPQRLSGRAVMADLETLDLIEAFYDNYSLPEYGITGTKPLSERAARYEGLVVYADRLEDVAGLQTRLESTFEVRTEARTGEIAATLGLGRNLNLALGLTAAVAALGLVATLVFGFWSMVMRRRVTLATLALLGLPAGRIFVFPLVQALVTAGVGLCVSFAAFHAAAMVAENLFGAGIGPGGIVSISVAEGAAISALVMLLVVASALYAAWEAQRADPATTLREA